MKVRKSLLIPNLQSPLKFQTVSLSLPSSLVTLFYTINAFRRWQHVIQAPPLPTPTTLFSGLRIPVLWALFQMISITTQPPRT